MLSKTKEKREAIRLRKLGLSLNEISGKLKVSKSSVSLWVGRMLLTEQAKQVLQEKRNVARQRAAFTNRARTERKLAESRKYGKLTLSQARFNQDALRVLCALLYWCEGAKLRKRSGFAFTNSDPLLVSAFLSLLRAGFRIDESRFRLQIHVHEYHDAKKQLRFWSKVTSIPLAQCRRPYQKSNTGKRIRESYQGCASVRYSDINLGRRVEAIARAYLESATGA